MAAKLTYHHKLYAKGWRYYVLMGWKCPPEKHKGE